MRVSVTGRHVSITESMDQYAREKVDKLPKFYDRIQSIEVIIDQDLRSHIDCPHSLLARKTYASGEPGHSIHDCPRNIRPLLAV